MTPRDLMTIAIIIVVAVVVIGGVVFLYSQPTQVERQIAADGVEWVEVSPPPDSGFDHCWVGLVGESTTLRAFSVCK